MISALGDITVQKRRHTPLPLMTKETDSEKKKKEKKK